MMNTLRADQDELGRFIGALFRYADADTFVSLRAFDQFQRGVSATLIRAIKINGSGLTPLIRDAARYAERSANAASPEVFAPPICTFSNPERARTEDLANGLCLSVEIDEGNTRAAQEKLEGLFGPATVIVASGSDWTHPDTGEVFPKIHIHWRLSEPTRDQEDHLKLYLLRSIACELIGADSTGKPVVHPLRWPGSWNVKGKPRLATIATLNVDSEIHLAVALEQAQTAMEAAGMERVGLPQSSAPQAPSDVLRSAMAAIPNEGTEVHYDMWIRMGYACFRASGGTDDGYDVWEAWSAKSEKFNSTETEAAWKRIRSAISASTAPRTIGAGTIFFYAAQSGWTRPMPEPPDRFDDPGYWESVQDPEWESPLDHAEPDGEVTRVADPWNALDPVAFPSHAIPPNIRSFINSRSTIIGCDSGAMAWACLSACSAAIDARVQLQMKRHDTWKVRPAIWVALIGLPSTKKTPIIQTAWGPLEKIQATAVYHYRLALAEWDALPKKERERIPKPPDPRRLTTHDATMEALQDILSKQDRGLGVLRDELSGWIGAMEKYAPGKGGAADRAFWLQGYNGGPHVVDRVMRGMLSINNLMVTVCGGIQPDRLNKFSDLTDDGLWQRFAPIIVGPATMGCDEPPGPDVEDYEALIQRLLAIPGNTALTLSHEAHLVRDDVVRRIFQLESEGVLGPRFVGFVGKLAGLWGRLALVLHCIVTPSNPTMTNMTVSKQTAEAARTLILDSVLPNAARVYMAMGGTAANIEATQSIAGYILTKGKRRLVASDLTNNVRVCRGQSLEDVRSLLSPLVAGGWLIPEREIGASSWIVSEIVHTQFAQQTDVERRRRESIRALINARLGQ